MNDSAASALREALQIGLSSFKNGVNLLRASSTSTLPLKGCWIGIGIGIRLLIWNCAPKSLLSLGGGAETGVFELAAPLAQSGAATG